MRNRIALFLLCTFTLCAAQEQTTKPEQGASEPNQAERIVKVCSAKNQPPCAKVRPKPTYTPSPEYTEEARRAHIQGTLTMSVVIGRDGLVHYVRLVKGQLGLGLTEKAIDTVKSWRFEPAKDENGSAVSVEVEVQVSFKLDMRPPS